MSIAVRAHLDGSLGNLGDEVRVISGDHEIELVVNCIALITSTTREILLTKLVAGPALSLSAAS